MTVSLTSVLSSYGYTAGKTETSATVAAALQKLAQQTEAKATQSSSGTQVSISPAAQAAADAQADNAKDAAALATEVRTSLDAQYAKGAAKGTPDFTGMTGRAVALVALNKNGQFSPAESRAAKAALREDTKASFANALGKTLDVTKLATFTQTMTAQYDAMSPEEREVRGWTPQLRATTSDFATKFAGSIPTLFDQ